ncbi:hypothetical protein BLL42_26990 (plasmid) [Pseudomonas frederiksbergensis]|uniref:Uncharacterized protein n=1 Tax=Pseudomonas frederiksbergensis TaxID=104087 RepID=A0A1J0ETR9_9PSED|nr:hypothetical protein [Pseudomonas frederiksbergensis]APC19390.1 hypothetical protein BLL42_26990 [Pseudomonas frederiksbergensis]
MPELTPKKAAVYAEVSDALDVEGYGDLLTGQPVDVHDALAQMVLDAEQMMNRGERLQSKLAEADDDAEVERADAEG